MRIVLNVLCVAIFVLSFDCITCEKRYCNEGLGVCTPFAQCSNLTKFNDGSDHLSVRFNIELETDACHYMELCCDPEDVIEEPFLGNEGRTQHVGESINDRDNRGSSSSDKSNLISTPETLSRLQECNSETHECIPFFYCNTDTTTDGAETLTTRNNFAGCDHESDVCCNKNENIARMVPTICGLRNKDGIGFSVTNSIDEAQYAEFPWMASLTGKLFDGTNNKDWTNYFCGGSLIHPSVVLTGAHCVYNLTASEIKVTLGEWDTKSTKEIFDTSVHQVKRIIPHEDFVPTNLYNDVALLILKTPAKLSVHINTICLPPPNNKIAQVNCFASGWGSDYYGEDAYRTNLKKVEVPPVPLRDCQEALRATKLGPRFKIHPSFMCAGGELGVDTCTGDGGSPLVCPVPGKSEVYYQAGVVAWGIECGKENVPGVYANVAKFRTWIDNKMNQLGYGTSSYTLE
ncbi:CLUMA_CG008074, isoform B [Clunio marinus]|nr:CLUMA_CG008074, isoform B [Clunio marinus]